MFKDRVGCNFLTSFTIVLSGTPSDWVLEWSRFLVEAIESERGRRAKFMNPQRKCRETRPFRKIDELFAPMSRRGVPGEAKMLRDATDAVILL